ncbi:MAG TPA: class I SAM-dependent methyltransferase [Tepidisphaeraceae bacterium]|jgi:SAM-dependent methyltransferase
MSHEDRNAREQAFHDEWASSLRVEDVLVDESWSAATCPEHRWFRSHLGELKGKRVLDLGCGAGEAAVWFAKNGADVVASDLSPQFLDLVQRLAAAHHTTLTTHLGDADTVTLPLASFDIVYAGNLLHHVDLNKTLDQILLLLKPGGVVLTWDPLKHNPAISVYRRMAGGVRTADEHPLSVRDVEAFRRRFPQVEYECFWFTTLWIFMRFYLIEGVHPSKERYWKKIVTEHERLTPLYNRLDRLDRWLFRYLPFLKRYGWTIAVRAVKAA